MKKILATVLALTMIVGMSIIPAFAAVDSTTGNGSFTQDVTGTYVFATNSTPVYGVEVAWTELTFVYTVGQGEWDPSVLNYKANASAQWTDNEGTITVTNKSNGAITASVGFTPVDGFAGNITGEAIEVAAAEVGAAKTGTIALTIAGGSITETGKIGTLTVTIAPKTIES